MLVNQDSNIVFIVNPDVFADFIAKCINEILSRNKNATT